MTLQDAMRRRNLQEIIVVEDDTKPVAKKVKQADITSDEFSIRRLLDPPEQVEKDMAFKIKLACYKLLKSVDCGSVDNFYPEVVLSFDPGYRTGDATDTGPGTFYAAAVTKCLWQSGVPCFSSLMVPPRRTFKSNCENDEDEVCFKVFSSSSRCKVLIIIETASFYKSERCYEQVRTAHKGKVSILKLRFDEEPPEEQDQWPWFSSLYEEGSPQLKAVIDVKRTLMSATQVPSASGTIQSMPSQLEKMLEIVAGSIDGTVLSMEVSMGGEKEHEYLYPDIEGDDVPLTAARVGDGVVMSPRLNTSSSGFDEPKACDELAGAPNAQIKTICGVLAIGSKNLKSGSDMGSNMRSPRLPSEARGLAKFHSGESDGVSSPSDVGSPRGDMCSPRGGGERPCRRLVRYKSNKGNYRNERDGGEPTEARKTMKLEPPEARKTLKLKPVVVGDRVEVKKETRLKGKTGAVINPRMASGMVQIRMDEDDAKGRIKSFKRSDLGLLRDCKVEENQFAVGDRVQVKKESRLKDKTAVVINPHFGNSMVQVNMDEDDQRGRTKSFKCSDLELVKDWKVEENQFAVGDRVEVKKETRLKGKTAVVINPHFGGSMVQVNMDEDDPRGKTKSFRCSDLRIIKEQKVEENQFALGDRVEVLKETRLKGKTAVVINPHFGNSMVQVNMDEDDPRGRTKSFRCSDLRIIKEQKVEEQKIKSFTPKELQFALLTE